MLWLGARRALSRHTHRRVWRHCVLYGGNSVLAFYQHYMPEKLRKADFLQTILTKYRGHEELLIKQLVAKYGQSARWLRFVAFPAQRLLCCNSGSPVHRTREGCDRHRPLLVEQWWSRGGWAWGFVPQAQSRSICSSLWHARRALVPTQHQHQHQHQHQRRR